MIRITSTLKKTGKPAADTSKYIRSWDSGIRCAVMQGGQGDVKHWAFNDPVKREGEYKDAPPSPEEYRKLSTRVVDLHPVTCMQNALSTFLRLKKHIHISV